MMARILMLALLGLSLRVCMGSRLPPTGGVTARQLFDTTIVMPSVLFATNMSMDPSDICNITLVRGPPPDYTDTGVEYDVMVGRSQKVQVNVMDGYHGLNLTHTEGDTAALFTSGPAMSTAFGSATFTPTAAGENATVMLNYGVNYNARATRTFIAAALEPLCTFDIEFRAISCEGDCN